MQRIVPMIADEDAVTHAELERDGAVVRSRRRTRSTAVRSGTSRPASRRPDVGRTAPWVVDDLFVAADRRRRTPRAGRGAGAEMIGPLGDDREAGVRLYGGKDLEGHRFGQRHAEWRNSHDV